MISPNIGGPRVPRKLKKWVKRDDPKHYRITRKLWLEHHGQGGTKPAGCDCPPCKVKR